jgi:hypothetical protein
MEKAVSSRSISIATSTSIIDVTNSLTVTTLLTDNTELAAVTSSISRDTTGLAAVTSTTSSGQQKGSSIQSTDAPAHLDGGAIGGIIGGILGCLLVILSVTVCIQFAFRRGRPLKWYVFKGESKVGGRTRFEDDDHINAEDNGLSGRSLDSEFETENGRIEKDGGGR